MMPPIPTRPSTDWGNYPGGFMEGAAEGAPGVTTLARGVTYHG